MARYDDDADDDNDWPDEADIDSGAIDSGAIDSGDSADDADDDVCPSCGAAVYHDADQCPRCGHYLTHEQATRPAKWVIVAAIVCLAVILLFWIV